jgi:endonuclease/exonuclease/phosphatase family metal-dependent hydrolase
MMNEPIPDGRDPASREAHALRSAFASFPTLRALHASPDWPRLGARLEAHLGGVRLYTAPRPPAPSADPGRVRVVQWNIEHGNRFEEIARALEGDPDLLHADLLSLNEVDLGMARSGNRDVAGDLAARLGLHGAWAAMFLENTRGRDDDALHAVDENDRESLFGLALLSRWPITAARCVPLPGPEALLFDRERIVGRFVALVAHLAHPVTPFVAVTVHLEVHRSRAHRQAQMKKLLDSLAGELSPVVLAGDWNTHTFDRGRRRTVARAAWALLAQPTDDLSRRLRQPDRGEHHEPLFDELRRSGFEWHPYVDGEPTLTLRFSRLGEVHALPWPLRDLASRGLGWAERRVRLRLDWIAARGVRQDQGSGHTVQGLDGPGLASDHAPIVANLVL